jgi:hypothetical protein
VIGMDVAEAQEQMIEDIASRAADKALERLFTTLGVDIDDPLEMQKDFAHLRAWRESLELVKRRSIISAVTVIVTGLAGFLYAILSHKF